MTNNFNFQILFNRNRTLAASNTIPGLYLYTKCVCSQAPLGELTVLPRPFTGFEGPLCDKGKRTRKEK